jgi:hypothetical protein
MLDGIFSGVFVFYEHFYYYSYSVALGIVTAGMFTPEDRQPRPKHVRVLI